MWSLSLFVHDRNLDPAESHLFHRSVQFHLAEAQPFIGIQFACLFKAMLCQIEDCNPPARLQNPPRFGYRALRMERMMQRLREEHQVYRPILDRNLLHIAQTVIDILYALPLRLLTPELHHLRRSIHSDHPLRSLRQ